MINKRYRLARNFLILSIVAICTVFGYILSAYADLVSSITIHDVSLTLQNDANDNGMVNIGDQIKVDLVVSNTDGSCAANTTATADLTVYGGGTDEALSCITDNGGVADVMSVTFTVVDAGPMGIDVGADDETSQVNVATADNDDIPGPNDNSNLMAQPVDTIAPTVSTENIYVTGATCLNDTFKLGDTPIYIWDPSEESDDLAWVTMNVSSFMVGVTDLLAGLDEGVYKSQIFDALESQDDFDNNISVTVSDAAGNTTTVTGTNDYTIDTIAPTIDGVLARLQNGDNTMHETNNWYYYSLEQNIRFVMYSNDELSSVKACVQSLVNGSGADACSIADPNDFEDGMQGTDYVNYTNDLGQNYYEFIIPISDFGIPPSVGGYVMNLYIVDNAGNVGYSAGQATSFGAVFGINPHDTTGLINENTTDWSEISDFTSVSPLVFSAENEGGLDGRIILEGPINLTEQSTINAMLSLGDYLSVSGDAIRIDSNVLTAFDGDATLIMHVDSEGGQPGLVIKDNDGVIQGYIGNAVDEEASFEIGGDILSGFSWDGEVGNLMFDTSGFSEFDTDFTAPTLLWARISGPNELKLVFSEPVTGNTDDFTDFRIIGEEEARNIDSLDGGETDTITLTFDGDPVEEGSSGTIDINNPLMLSVEDMVGNELDSLDDQPVIDGQTAPDVVFVDDDYTGATNAGGHIWDYDAFDTVQEGINAVAEDGTVNVLTGDYESSKKITISTNGLQLIGPGIGEGVSRAIIRNTNCSKHTIAVLASNVRIEGLQLEQKSEGEYCGRDGQPVVRLNDPAVGTEVVNNDIAGGENGILFPYDTSEGLASGNVIHDNSHGIAVNSPSTIIENNEIYNSVGTDVSVGYGIWFRCLGETCDSSASIVRGNNIHGNGYGIFFNAFNQDSAVTIGPNNTIENNSEGVYVLGDSENLFVNGNTIQYNTQPDSGLHVEDNSIGLDASRNYWGDASGPYEAEDNASGTGDTITIINSSDVVYRPFYTDSDRTTFALDTAHTVITLNSLNPTVITSPSNVANGKLDVSSLLTGLSGVLPQLTINASTTAGAVSVAFPASTTVTGAIGWTGIINVPTVKENSSVTVTADSGKTASVQSVLEIGFDDVKLSFDRGVRLKFTGKAGKYIGFSRGGIFAQITSSCANDSQATGDGLVAEGDCKIDVGEDLIVWTKHFSSFVLYTQSLVASSGGGATIIAVLPRAATTDTKLDFTINNGETITNSNVLTLNLNADESVVTGYAASLDMYFDKASIEKYYKSVKFYLPEKDGVYTIYLKYFSTTGNSSETISRSIELKGYKPGAQTETAEAGKIKPIVKYMFNKNLRQGSRGEDVLRLQKFLNDMGILVSSSGAGSPGSETSYFGPATRKAVVALQEEFADKILKPIGLKKGTGFFYSLTRKFVNEL